MCALGVFPIFVDNDPSKEQLLIKHRDYSRTSTDCFFTTMATSLAHSGHLSVHTFIPQCFNLSTVATFFCPQDGRFPGGYSTAVFPEWGGAARPLIPLTLFKTNIADFPTLLTEF